MPSNVDPSEENNQCHAASVDAIVIASTISAVPRFPRLLAIQFDLEAPGRLGGYAATRAGHNGHTGGHISPLSDRKIIAKAADMEYPATRFH